DPEVADARHRPVTVRRIHAARGYAQPLARARRRQAWRAGRDASGNCSAEAARWNDLRDRVRRRQGRGGRADGYRPPPGGRMKQPQLIPKPKKRWRLKQPRKDAVRLRAELAEARLALASTP